MGYDTCFNTFEYCTSAGLFEPMALCSNMVSLDDKEDLATMDASYSDSLLLHLSPFGASLLVNANTNLRLIVLDLLYALF